MSEPKRLLIVDDDVTFGDIMQAALARRGLAVKVARSGAEALQCVRHWPCQQVLLDLKLGNESGLTLLPDLLTLRPQLRIVILTGYSSISTAVTAIKRGAHQYLCKPVNADEVLNAFTGEAGQDTPAIPAQPTSVDRLTWEHIQKVLQEHDGNISATARALNMHRRTLQRKLAKRPVRQ